MEIAYSVPKSELHLHLDGSLDTGFIAACAADRGIELPVESADIRQYLHDLKSKRAHIDSKVSSSSNWSNFDFCNQFLQTSDELRGATFSLCETLIADNVVLAEIRFCPELHTNENLTANDAVDAVVSGFREAEQTLNMRGGVIVCALRSYAVEHTIEMVELASAWLGQGVIGFDIAGDEGAFALDIHESGIKEALRRNVPMTLHAGEWPEDTIKNIKLAVDLGVDRIGHGVTLCQDPKLMNLVADEGITVECCLTSNVGWKVPSYAVHPIRNMFEAGVKVCINSDNLLLSGSFDRAAYSTGEVQRLVNDVGFTWEQARQVLLNGVMASFSPGVDEDWISQYKQRLDTVLSK